MLKGNNKTQKDILPFAGQRLPTQFGKKTAIRNQIHKERLSA